MFLFHGKEEQIKLTEGKSKSKVVPVL